MLIIKQMDEITQSLNDATIFPIQNIISEGWSQVRYNNNVVIHFSGKGGDGFDANCNFIYISDSSELSQYSDEITDSQSDNFGDLDTSKFKLIEDEDLKMAIVNSLERSEFKFSFYNLPASYKKWTKLTDKPTLKGAEGSRTEIKKTELDALTASTASASLTSSESADNGVIQAIQGSPR